MPKSDRISRTTRCPGSPGSSCVPVPSASHVRPCRGRDSGPSWHRQHSHRQRDRGRDKSRASGRAFPARASVIVAINNCSSARDLSRAQRNRRTQIETLVDIDIGLGRCGVRPGDEALRLAKFAVAEGLKFRGLMGYDGHLQAVRQSPDRDDLVRTGSKCLVDSAALIESAGIPVPVISTGGTGTYAVSGKYPGVTEIQPGSYLLMDTLYLDRGAPFQRSLTVLTTVISTRGAEHAVIDCGVKAMSGERGLSTVKDLPGVRLKALHAEHGLLEIQTDSTSR